MWAREPMLSSPIKWVGGKSKLRRQVIEYLPSNAECYAEVFAGAAWVLFGKPCHPVEVLNDKNGDLVNLWRVLKWRPAELLEEVHKHLYSREMFYELRATRPPQEDELGRAVWLYLLIQMSFGADVSSTQSSRFGYRNKSRGDLFLYKSLKQFTPAKERLRGVFIENQDFADLIRRYDQPRTVFYLDPPYFEKCDYEEKFSFEDHARLAECLRSIEGRFLMTVNDHAEIRTLYRDQYLLESMEPSAISRSAEARQAAPILFISNYPLYPVQQAGESKRVDDQPALNFAETL
jgi:DNA adenine methylase